MRTWTVEVNLCVQSESLYAAGECPVLRSDRSFDGILIRAGTNVDGILIRAGTIEWSWTAVAGGDEQPNAFELLCCFQVSTSASGSPQSASGSSPCDWIKPR